MVVSCLILSSKQTRWSYYLQPLLRGHRVGGDCSSLSHECLLAGAQGGLSWCHLHSGDASPRVSLGTDAKGWITYALSVSLCVLSHVRIPSFVSFTYLLAGNQWLQFPLQLTGLTSSAVDDAVPGH